MQQYDIATKALITACRDDIIRYFTGLDVRESTMIEELPQETVSLKRSDFPVLVTDSRGDSRLVILEIQTRWERRVPLNLLDYRTRYLIKHDSVKEVISCVVLLRPSPSATNNYRDNEVNFTFRLVKIYETDARDIVSQGPLCLMPFVPLMKNGVDLTDDADALIYESELPRSEKADVLTSMAILSGLVSNDLPAKLVSRRKDIMIESAAYDIIKREGFLEGMQKGMQEGIGMTLLESLGDILEVKFGIDGMKLYGRLRDIEDVDKLKAVIKAVKLAKSPEEVSAYADSL